MRQETRMEGVPMECSLESAAKKFGVPPEVLDLIGRQFISKIIEDFPCLLLPPIMDTLKHGYVRNGLEWVKENVASLQREFLEMKRLYGPTWILA
jgi:hypothetical protein